MVALFTLLETPAHVQEIFFPDATHSLASNHSFAKDSQQGTDALVAILGKRDSSANMSMGRCAACECTVSLWLHLRSLQHCI